MPAVLERSVARYDPIGITGTGAYLPSSVLTNAELSDRMAINPDWIEDRTGVYERRVAAAGEATSDLASVAARRAMRAAGIGADEVDLIIVATSTPDKPMPATACIVQANLGLGHCPAFDVDAVCTGFVYALEVARSMMSADPRLRHAVVIGADIYSRILDYTDRRTASLFGDGAGAVILSRVPAEFGIKDVELGADGSKADYVSVPAGGSRAPATAETLDSGDHFFKMDGRAVRKFAENIFELAIDGVLDRCEMTVGELDLVVPHQANVRLLEDCAKKSGLHAPHRRRAGRSALPGPGRQLRDLRDLRVGHPLTTQAARPVASASMSYSYGTTDVLSAD
ncbi:3-oxoacyl-ACP synthase III family protein [Sphaerisporangium perillae]|uniref:3-oxoacyl-ACP synthase III family protein n=1 Tax=Sphaerisporangium perillae TaxID=2935860 RepID=UPI00201013E9|nr:beta-ketoacyl-ACP synthase 3 [Sphaerisporangium perillae]